MAEGMSNLVVRRSNKKSVLKMLYLEKNLTRRDISLKLGLSLPTVSQIMKELEDEGLIKNVGQQKSSGGRKPVMSDIIEEVKSSLGIAITQDNVRFVLLNLGPSVLATDKLELAFEDSPAYWSSIAAKAQAFLDENKIAEETLLGCGISFPGIIQGDSEVLEFAPTLRSAPIYLGKLRQYFDTKLMFGNDAVVAGKAELWFKNRNETVLYLLLNTGVGGSILSSDARPLFGARAGEFGHMVIDADGKQCTCGKKGCFEAYCSSEAIREFSGVSIDEFFEGLKKGNNPEFNRIWNTYLDYLAIGIDNLKCAFDVPIIVGGELSHHVEQYSGELRDKLLKRSCIHVDASFVQMSNYSEYDSAVGAALLHIDDFFENQQ